MPKECTTHHHACDCREKIIRDISKYIINFHAYLLKTASASKYKFVCECSCDICNKARTLLDIPLTCSCGFPHEHDQTEREKNIIAYYERKLL